MNQIKDEVAVVVKSCSPQKIQNNAFVDLNSPQAQRPRVLLRMCISVLAAWPIYVIFLILYFNPFRYHFSLHTLFSEGSAVTQFMFSENILIAFIAVLILASLVPIEIIWLTILGFFISNGDIHLTLAITGGCAVFFALARRNLKKSMLLSGPSKNTLMVFSGLQIFSVVVATVIIFFLYKSMRDAGYFSVSMTANRFEFFVLTVFIQHFVQFGILSLWGHYVSRRS